MDEPQPAGGWKRWLVGIVVLGAALRLYDLGERSIWYDEGAVLYVSQYLSDPIKFLNPDYCNDAPLHIVLASVWYTIVSALPGVEQGSRLCDALIRLYPCLAGIAGIVLTFVVGRRLTGNTRAGLIAAFLFSISPFQVYYAQDLRAYPLHVVLNLCAVYCMIRALDENRARWWIGLTLAMSAGIYNHFFMVWCVVALNVCFVVTMRRHWKLTLHWTACNLAVILLSVPALRMALYVSLVFDTAQEVWYVHPDLRHALITFKNFFAGYSASVVAYQALTLMAGGACAAGLWTLRKKYRAAVMICVLAFLPIVLAVLYWRTKDFPYYTHRLFIFSAVPCYWLVAQGLAALPGRALRGAAIGLFAVCTLPGLADYYAQRLHPIQTHTLGILYKPDNRGAAHALAAEYNPETDIIVHRIRYTRMPFMHYLDAPQTVVDLTYRQVVSAMIGYPSIYIYETSGIFPKELHTMLARGKRLWLVNSWWEPFAMEPGTMAMAGWLDAHAVRAIRMPFDGVDVYRYELQRPFAAGLRRAIVQDTGSDRLPVYVDPTTRRSPQHGTDIQHGLATAREEADDLVLRFDSRVEGPDADVAGLERVARMDDSALFSSFGLRGEEAWSSYVLENLGDRPRRVYVAAFTSAALIEAEDFSPAERNSSVWRYGLQYPLSPEEPVPNRLAIGAALTPQSPDGKMITAGVATAPGRYDVWALIKTAHSTVNHDGAAATFSMGFNGAEDLIGIVVPTEASLPAGWNWVRVGTADIRDETSTLVVGVGNPERLPRASFHLARVRLLPEGVEGAFLEETVELGAGETASFEQQYPLMREGVTRVDIEAYEAATASWRSLSFPVARPRVNTAR